LVFGFWFLVFGGWYFVGSIYRPKAKSFFRNLELAHRYHISSHLYFATRISSRLGKLKTPQVVGKPTLRDPNNANEINFISLLKAGSKKPKAFFRKLKLIQCWSVLTIFNFTIEINYHFLYHIKMIHIIILLCYFINTTYSLVSS